MTIISSTSGETFCVVGYYKAGEVVRTSRFKDAVKAAKAVLSSQLAGQHAQILASNLTIHEVRVLQGKYKPTESSNSKIKSRTEISSHGTHTILSTRVKLIQND